MGFRTLLRTTILVVALCILLSHRQKVVKASSPSGNENNHITRNRAIRFSSRFSPQYMRSRVDPNPDFMADDDDLFDLTKRQSDDYGHMRFGKRDFEDYGHMRFGRAGSE